MQKICATLCSQVAHILQGKWNNKWRQEDRTKIIQFLIRDFPPTDYVCDSNGDLIHFEGEYSVDKHIQAWERSKKWLPYWHEDDLKWMCKPRGPFKRLVNTQPLQCFEKINGVFTLSMPHQQEDHWSGGLPPIQVGMLGHLGKAKAVVVAQDVSYELEVQCVGIGDPGALFKDFSSRNKVEHLGVVEVKTETKHWVIRTKKKEIRIRHMSSRFKRSIKVIRDISRQDLIDNYFNSE